jgi:AcrR family transcriptional regulator
MLMLVPHFEPVRLVSKFTLPSDPMTDQPRPGRKRSEQSRLAILAATLDLVAEAGYGTLTVEGIAARSGVGKQTIYRWWPSKADVLLDALATKADLYVPIPDEGTFRADLAGFLDSTFELGEKAQVADTLRALMAQAQIDPEFGKRFREDFLNRRREALGVIVDRARERGELPEGVNSGTVIDVVFGTLWYRLLATRAPLGHGLAGELVTLLADHGASTAEIR